MRYQVVVGSKGQIIAAVTVPMAAEEGKVQHIGIEGITPATHLEVEISGAEQESGASSLYARLQAAVQELHPKRPRKKSRKRSTKK